MIFQSDDKKKNSFVVGPRLSDMNCSHLIDFAIEGPNLELNNIANQVTAALASLYMPPIVVSHPIMFMLT